MPRARGRRSLFSPGARELPRAEAFRAWLGRHTKLGERAVGDTVSRAKRASALIALEGPADENHIGSLFKRNSDYLKCTPSVRSQLKKAVLLYRRFSGGR